MTDNFQMKALGEALDKELVKYKSAKDVLTTIEGNIITLKKLIYDSCIHKWEVDRGYYSEHTEYICRECGMSK
jgi:hypothetical protein